MAGLVITVINGERFDKPGEKLMATELKLKGEKLQIYQQGGLKLEKALNQFGLSVEGKSAVILELRVALRMSSLQKL